MNTTPSRQRPRLLGVTGLALGIATATVLAGCTASDNGDDSTSGGTVAVGASAAEYTAALADMAPVELIVQMGAPVGGASETDPRSVAVQAMLDRVTEYSGGKITFDVTYANGIVANLLEIDDALLDGRMDMSGFMPQYDPAEYPVQGLVLETSVFRAAPMVVGWASSMAAMQEIGLSTPEAVAELKNRGLIPLNIMSPDGMVVIACAEPATSLADLQDKQIRVGGTSHARQVEGLGAIPVSLPATEVYEATQRGIVDCVMAQHGFITDTGIQEVAPYIMSTERTSFVSTPTNFYAGPRVAELPQAAQQLIVESAQLAVAELLHQRMTAVLDGTIAQATEHGGMLAFDDDVEERLAEVNDGLLDEVASSELLNGGDLVRRAEAIFAKWDTKVTELGFTDEGPAHTLTDGWFNPDSYDYNAWFETVVTDIIAEYSPV